MILKRLITPITFSFNTLSLESFLLFFLSSFVKGIFFDFNLHTRGTFRTVPRPRGLTQVPLDLNGVIEIPEHEFSDLEKTPPVVRAFIKKYLGNNRWTEISAKATNQILTIERKRKFSFQLNADSI